MNLIDKNQWIDRISKISLGPRSSYLAMYSTWWDAVVIDPNLMMIPIDDHQVHRGDAVFEAMKAVHHKVYLFDEHLLRLERSMSQIDLTPPFSIKEIKQKVVETLNFTNDPACLIRLFVGRGPGSFTANPYDTIGSQLHIIITTLTPPAEDKVNSGVSLMTSKVKVKDSFMAQIKSCNYLANVLMKKEAVDHKVDFSIGVDSMGHFTEGSTENLIIVNQALPPSLRRHSKWDHDEPHF
jgi:4-amino-4-deoxychorismate lyase